MVGCSENITNLPEQLPSQAIGPLLYSTLLADEYTIFVLFLSRWIEREIN